MKKLSKLFLVITSASILLLNTACEEDMVYVDTTPPNPPRNVQTIVGDNTVEITWSPSYEDDLAGYNIYFAWDYNGRYELIGSTKDNFYIDYEARNGEKYFYAVVAYDFNGNESELSSSYAYGAPRPEGYDQSIFDYTINPDNSGYIFSEYAVAPFDKSDFFFEIFEGVPYLNVWEDTDIQDMGATKDIYDIDYAPNGGWVPKYPDDNIKYVEAQPGHTYVVWTWDNHFAKVRISLITNERIKFDWTYQTIEGEGQLKRNISKEKRDELPKKAIVKSR